MFTKSINSSQALPSQLFSHLVPAPSPSPAPVLPPLVAPIVPLALALAIGIVVEWYERAASIGHCIVTTTSLLVWGAGRHFSSQLCH